MNLARSIYENQLHFHKLVATTFLQTSSKQVKVNFKNTFTISQEYEMLEVNYQNMSKKFVKTSQQQN